MGFKEKFGFRERERERVISNGQKENLSLRFEREKSGKFFQIEHF